MKQTKLAQFAGMKFNYFAGDKYIGERIALGKYEPYLTQLMMEKAAGAGVVIDVGANIGFDSILFARAARKVVAIEPESDNFKLLCKNIEENQMKNIEAVRGGAGSKMGEMELIKSVENLGDHRLESSKAKGPSNPKVTEGKAKLREKVKMITIDDLAGNEKVDLIKVDTQGWEIEVIEGAIKTIKRDHPMIFMEFWPWAYKNNGHNMNKMLEFLYQEYGSANYVDEYIQVYYPVGKKRLLDLCGEGEGEYKNIWFARDRGVDYWKGAVKDFWPKKLAKRMLGRPAT